MVSGVLHLGCLAPGVGSAEGWPHKPRPHSVLPTPSEPSDHPRALTRLPSAGCQGGGGHVSRRGSGPSSMERPFPPQAPALSPRRAPSTSLAGALPPPDGDKSAGSTDCDLRGLAARGGRSWALGPWAGAPSASDCPCQAPRSRRHGQHGPASSKGEVSALSARARAPAAPVQPERPWLVTGPQRRDAQGFAGTALSWLAFPASQWGAGHAGRTGCSGQDAFLSGSPEPA